MNDATPSTTPPLWERALPAAPSSCPASDELKLLALDAAQRAAALLSGQHHPEHDPVVDLVRLLHNRTESAVAEAAAQRAGLSTAGLGRLRAAYAFGGVEGVRNAHYAIDADPSILAEAVRAIEGIKATPTPAPQTERNRITYDTTKVQIRVGTDQRWYPYTRTSTEIWAPAPGHSLNPVEAYLAAVQAARNRNR